MGWKSALVAALLVCHFSHADPAGVDCTYETQSSGLLRSTCTFPTCPQGEDCRPPEIERTSGRIEFKAPWVRVRRPCNAPMEGDTAAGIPASCKTIRGACWEAKHGFKFFLSASDPSDVAEIGVGLAIDVTPEKRVFEQHLRPAKKLGSRYFMEDEVHVCTPMAGKVDISVLHLCAVDGQHNEGCTLPQFNK